MRRVGYDGSGGSTMTVKRVPTPAGDLAWLVTDYDQVKSLLADRRLGRSHPDPANAPRFTDSAILGKPNQGTMEEEYEAHAWMRRSLAPSFSARHMESMRPRVRQLVDGLLDELVKQDQPANFHEAVAFPLPVLVICELLGVPFEDRARFREWSEAASLINDEQKSLAGLGQLFAYMGQLVERRKAEPGDDVISRLIESSSAGQEEKIAQLSAGLLFAGHETTVAAIDRGVMLLSLNPGQWDSLRKDPSGISDAVEEILRLPAPTKAQVNEAGLPRYALADLDVDGVHIPAGDLVMLGIEQANHDEERFPEPAVFARRESNPHLTFGFGPRFCVGAPLARVELTEVFLALTTRFDTFELAVGIDELSPREDQLVGGVMDLPVRWKVRAETGRQLLT
ncbi:cytochrome P450 [Lentzea alba]|uniref:cytochrome P450 n=1 Tax=Lentzea alba TaxID=2714351 RepID=UPI0039BF8A60